MQQRLARDKQSHTERQHRGELLGTSLENLYRAEEYPHIQRHQYHRYTDTVLLNKKCKGIVTLRVCHLDSHGTLARASAQKGKDALLLMLDGIEDPHNLGALCRSASALGAQGVIIGKDRAVGITPTAIKASAGALPGFKVARVTNLSRAIESLRELGFWSVAADMKGERPPEGVDYSTPTLVVVGSEGKGIRRAVLDKCDFKVRIPMVGPISSLNASVAGAILLAEVARQRRQG